MKSSPVPDRQIVPFRRRDAVALRLVDVSVAYDGRVAVEGVSSVLQAGTVVGLLGPNGAGKTTLLRAVMGVVPLAGGAVYVHEMPPREAWYHMSYLPQHEQINWEFPVSVLEAVLMGRARALGWLRAPGPDDKQRAMDALERVGMEGHARRRIAELSRGQRQRVLIARALAQEGDVVVLDEPLAGVDTTTQEAVVRLLRSLRDQGMLVLVSMHDLGVAADVCDQLLCLNRRLLAFGPPRTVFVPEVLRATYGSTVAIVGAGTAVHDARR
jgi:manganese/zinc/iron transport system ATP- binding protein